MKKGFNENIMTGKIYDISKPLPESTEYKGVIYPLKLYFNRVLMFYDLFNNDGLLSDADKYIIGFEWFTDCEETLLTPDEKAEFVNLLIQKYVVSPRRVENNSIKIVDFSQDSGYIYASFMSDYGIDLLEQHDRLHWWKFRALFDGLSEKSIIKKIMQIRAAEIPAPTQNNHKEIEYLLEQKRYYELNISQQEKEKNVASGWAKLFAVMEQRSK